jgi:hypothetical protein
LLFCLSSPCVDEIVVFLSRLKAVDHPL